MIYQVSQQTATETQASCIVVTLDQSGKLSDTALQLDEASQGFISQRFEQGDISGKLAETLLLPAVSGITASRVLLVGTGKETLKPASAQKVLAAIANTTNRIGGDIALALTSLTTDVLTEAWLAEQTAIAYAAAQYRFTATKSSSDAEAKSPDTLIWLGDDVSAAFSKGAAIGTGISFAKELANMPPNICTPTWLAENAVTLTQDQALETTILDEDQLAEMGAGAFVSVSKGSTEPGKIIVMQYRGADDPTAAPHMILGKGITFDTGGISLKPGQKMDEMKYDMCGAASVLGTMKAILTLKPKVNVLAIVTSAENMPAGNASKPGDVVTSLSGKTIEILNTDAEGRLVLCDALTYGIDNYQPASIVDIATLTGACMAALGEVNSGLFTTDEAMAEQLQAAAQYSNDKVWRLPLEEEYQDLIDSNFADIANIGGPLAGATTAACFLSRFTEGTPWAHLDIAGTAWVGGKAKGATGRPVSLLVNYLLNK
ncbi:MULTISPECIES: leucyl aminopeptidase [unclassified Oceanobacter]|uniref:leucyl aminopeptidase n=1 Tax=unclassified Oceanobacter TaxID=2620260 RepID=UPI002734F105|nr:MULTISPECIES: leucyl aminopeptidase [unclassified Oceanobacter]MDP2609320.1 leucyl aminopeptidase [Oceanobacter sp. 1_MG-2023]MDP2612583.1 leucyl aminopeptidase [Oceanobacter sp. 2_MG-2023]